MTDTLTPKQRRFVDEYLIDLNGTQAAIRTGYAPHSAAITASKLLTIPKIASAVALAGEKRSERTQIDADYVLKGINRAIQRCEQVAPVLDARGEPVLVETPDGSLTPAFKFDSPGVFRGYELLGKHLKLFTDKVELTGANGGGLEVRVAAMTPEERRAEIQRLLTQHPALTQPTLTHE
jgi:phage terminase small subunit